MPYDFPAFMERSRTLLITGGEMDSTTGFIEPGYRAGRFAGSCTGRPGNGCTGLPGILLIWSLL